MIWLAYSILILAVLLRGLIYSRFRYFNKQYNFSFDETPLVSVLLAVRNEENSIIRCLESLADLDYPKERIEILIGDDDSDDGTAKLVKTFIEQHENFFYFKITEKVGLQKGKANVLAQLERKAQGEYYLFTDADMKLPSSWVTGMLSSMEPNVGLAIGVTSIKSDKFQELDWLTALGMVKVVTDMDRLPTGMGNNMIVSAAAYRAVGGYENIPFSLTEDYELYKYIGKEGFECRHIFNDKVLGISLPIIGFRNLLNQRKRWMKGAFQLPLFMILLLIIPILFYASLIWIMVIFGLKVLVWVLPMIGLQWLFQKSIYKKLGLQLSGGIFLLFEFYNVAQTLIVIINYFLPSKIHWKGRTY